MSARRRPKHRARRSSESRMADRLFRREWFAWFMAGKQYPSAPGRHAAEVTR